MSWLFELHRIQPIVYAIGVLSFALGTFPLTFPGLPHPVRLGLAGGRFFATAFTSIGLQWMAAGLCVTMVPLVLVGLFARGILKMNFMDLSGLFAGSMTNPPGLSFATNIARSDAPNVAYATVYPLTTLLRILSAQVLAILFFQ
jgi:putative transport protein